ncbi:RteC domain-containing protein [Chitinophaga sp. LS1]|uniref:RteC domain-containing protein n=1 Tax=Chitinophaga sp. LS1 TaxID=3051176 RepID=UPI002AABE96A|nr:RteC domain-containing protein [Chitinophaga sp. LS1]WPV67540.1 RteC domain-containing protein [Chitinophaga sp. LS1]
MIEKARSMRDELLNEFYEKIPLYEKDIIEALQKVSSDTAYLKSIMASYNFDNEKDEIEFYKEIKPEFDSTIIFLFRLHSIILNCPTAHQKQIDYFDTEIIKIKKFYSNNKEFLLYFNSGSTHLDKFYFLKRDEFIWINPDEGILFDERFLTPMSSKIACLKAWIKLETILKITIQTLTPVLQNGNSNSHKENTVILKWTGKINDIVELGYFIYCSRQINNGEVSINQIFEWIQSSLHINVGNQYRTWQANLIRKNPTQGIDKMVNNYKEYIDNTLLNPRYYNNK